MIELKASLAFKKTWKTRAGHDTQQWSICTRSCVQPTALEGEGGKVLIVQATLPLAIAEDNDLELKFFYLLKWQHFILFIYLLVYLSTYFEGRVPLC